MAPVISYGPRRVPGRRGNVWRDYTCKIGPYTPTGASIAAMLTHQSVIAMLIAAAFVGEARPLFADCVFAVRPATAAEKKIYADGFALFQRMAPAVPAGWEQNDTPKDGTLKEVCAAPGASVTQWRFARGFTRTEGMQDRHAKTMEQLKAIGEQGKATAKANEAKLADNQRQMEAAMKKMQALATAQKAAEMEAVSAEIERLGQARMKLMGVAEQETAIKALDAESQKDTYASFSVSVGETEVDTRSFKPMTVAVGRGYRQEIDSGGNPKVDIMVVLPPSSAGTGQTVVRISGDPSRADGLLKAAKLR